MGPESGPNKPLPERMAAAARELEDQTGSADLLDAAVHLAVRNVADCDEAGVSIVRRGARVETPAATGEEIVVADGLQYETGEGPCLDAIKNEGQEYVRSADLRVDQRWPTWGPAVAERTGLASILSVRLFTAKNTMGALNLYSRGTDVFGPDDRQEALALAAHVAVATSAVREVAGLTAALDTRSLVGQAMGILMERHDLTADEAWTRLTRVSSNAEMRVNDVAAELVRTRRLPGR